MEKWKELLKKVFENEEGGFKYDLEDRDQKTLEARNIIIHSSTIKQIAEIIGYSKDYGWYITARPKHAKDVAIVIFKL